MATKRKCVDAAYISTILLASGCYCLYSHGQWGRGYVWQQAVVPWPTFSSVGRYYNIISKCRDTQWNV